MQIHNHLPLLLDCLRRWEQRPSLKQFEGEYWSAIQADLWVGGAAARLWRGLTELDWARYREETLALDPAREEQRLRRNIAQVEQLFGIPLTGSAILFGAFTFMDGYARFDRGVHKVYLGVDESHGRGAYLDVLETHELTHVVRETRPSVWEPWGLSLEMSHDELFEEKLPTVEHLLNEGLACAVSELLNPDEDPWHYAYQEEDALEHVLLHAPAVDRTIHEELAKGGEGDYGQFYSPHRYGKVPLPIFSHYVWAWQWAKHLIRDVHQGDVRALVVQCSKELVEDALAFKLEGTKIPPRRKA